MTQFLPPNLLVLFAARDPIPFLAPIDKPTHEKKRQPYTGVSEYLVHFEDPEDTPLPTKPETKLQKLDRKRREKAEQNAYKLEQDLAMWHPDSNSNSTTDPYKTLFVARINYDSSESKLRREFEVYGKIKQIKLIHDTNSDKPRGYAFIEYEDESSMHAAYKRADGKKIDGRRVVVDIERGRTIKGWKPRRLGGGKGGRKSHFDPSLKNIDDIEPIDDRISGSSKRPSSVDRDRSDRDRDRDTRRRSKERESKRSRSRSRDRKKRSKSKDRNRSRSKDRVKKARRSRSKERVSGSSKKRSRSREKNRLKEEFNENKNGNSQLLNVQ